MTIPAIIFLLGAAFLVAGFAFFLWAQSARLTDGDMWVGVLFFGLTVIGGALCVIGGGWWLLSHLRWA